MVKNNKSGFTLVELLVVVTVIVAFSAYTLGVYHDYNENVRLTEETAKLAETFELAKKKTTAVEKSCAGYTGNYIVSWTTSTYTLTPDGCPAQKSYTLPTGIVLTSAGSVSFKPFGLGVDTEATITLKNTSLTKCRSISVGSSGVVTDAEVVCP